MRRWIIASLLIVACQPVAAGETPWQELAPDVRARLISADKPLADGTTMLALELDMPANYKTYWRVPGEAGIATEIEWSGSTGLASADIVWPLPAIEVTGGYFDYVYRGPTVLPIRATLDGDVASVLADVTMGICSDICVPALATFTLDVSLAKPDRGQALRIDQALALVPKTWPGAPEPIGAARWSDDASGLLIEIDTAAIRISSLIVTPVAGSQLFGAAEETSEAGVVFLPLLGNDVATDVSGPIEVTFLTENGPYWVSKTIDTAQ